MAARGGWWRIARAAFAVAIVVAVFAAIIPAIADYGAVWRIVARLTSPQLAIVACAAALNLVSYWVQSVAAMPGLTLRMASVQTQTTTTIANTVPAGGAVAVGVSVAMFHSWGYTDGDVARYAVVTGIWNTYVKLGLPIVALALVSLEGRADAQLAFASMFGVAALLVSVALLVLMLWKASFAERIGGAMQRPVRWARRRLGKPTDGDWRKAAARFRRDTIELLRSWWLPLTVTTIASHLLLFATLLVSLRVVGISPTEITLIDALAAFSFARLVTALPVTPGGLGVVELSYIGTLVWAGGGRIDVVAAVLLFRAITYLLQIPLGAMTYPVWQATKDRWRRTDAATAPQRRRTREHVGAAA